MLSIMKIDYFLKMNIYYNRKLPKEKTIFKTLLIMIIIFNNLSHNETNSKHMYYC